MYSPDPNPAPSSAAPNGGSWVVLPAAPGDTREASPTPEVQSLGPSAGLILALGLALPALLTLSMVSSSETKVFAAVLAFLGGLVILSNPYWGLIVFVGLLYTRPEESIPELQGMRLPLIVSVTTLAGMYLKHFLERKRLLRTPANVMMIGFFLAGVITSIMNPMSDVGVAVEDFAKLAILVVLATNLIRTPRQYQTYISATLLFIVWLCLYSLKLRASGVALEYAEGGVRSLGTGIFADPNDLASTMVVGLALAMTRVRAATGAKKWLYVATAALILWSIFLTNSRGGMLAILTVCGGFFYFTSKSRVAGLVIAGALMALLLALGPARMTTFDSGEESANARFAFWNTGIEMLKLSPIYGIGYLQFTEYNDGRAAHNSFVCCFAELGLFGYFFWCGLLYFAFRRVKDDGWQTEEYRRELLGTRLTLAGFLVAIFWLTRTYVPPFYLLAITPACAHFAYSGNDNVYEDEKLPWSKQWMHILLLVIGSIVVIKLMILKFR